MTPESIYHELTLWAQRVVGADADPEPVPRKRDLAVARVGAQDEADFASVEIALREALEAEGDRATFEGLVDQLAEDDYWARSALGEDLRRHAEALRALLDGPPEGETAWFAYDRAQMMIELFDRMYRRLEREALDDALVAAKFVVRELGQLDDEAIGGLLAEQPSYIADLRAESERSAAADPPWDEARACLIAQLTFDLRESATPEAILLWFRAPHSELETLTPLQAIDTRGSHDPGATLRRLARSSRGQIYT